MADAKMVKRMEIVEQEVAVEEYVLTLSKEEAQFVLNYLGQTVTGSVGSLRKYADSVYSALRLAGVVCDADFPNSIMGGIQRNYFKGIQGGY